jgi:hypothetical protein
VYARVYERLHLYCVSQKRKIDVIHKIVHVGKNCVITFHASKTIFIMLKIFQQINGDSTYLYGVVLVDTSLLYTRATQAMARAVEYFSIYILADFFL